MKYVGGLEFKWMEYVGGLKCGKVCCNHKDTKRKSLSNKRKNSKRKYAACIQCNQYLRNIDMVDKYLFINVALICFSISEEKLLQRTNDGHPHHDTVKQS